MAKTYKENGLTFKIGEDFILVFKGFNPLGTIELGVYGYSATNQELIASCQNWMQNNKY